MTSLVVSEMEERAVLEATEGLRLGVASFSFLGARGAILLGSVRRLDMWDVGRAGRQAVEMVETRSVRSSKWLSGD